MLTHWQGLSLLWHRELLLQPVPIVLMFPEQALPIQGRVVMLFLLGGGTVHAVPVVHLFGSDHSVVRSLAMRTSTESAAHTFMVALRMMVAPPLAPSAHDGTGVRRSTSYTATQQFTPEMEMNLPMNLFAEVPLMVSSISTHTMQVSEWGNDTPKKYMRHFSQFMMVLSSLYCDISMVATSRLL
jgi:hypothetical protein